MKILFIWFGVLMGLSSVVEGQTLIEGPELGCNIQVHAHKVKQFDSQGRSCTGEVKVLICKGRCDSKEISDWKFPYKRAFHPVCLHVSQVTHCSSHCFKCQNHGRKLL